MRNFLVALFVLSSFALLTESRLKGFQRALVAKKRDDPLSFSTWVALWDDFKSRLEPENVIRVDEAVAEDPAKPDAIQPPPADVIAEWQTDDGAPLSTEGPIDRPADGPTVEGIELNSAASKKGKVRVSNFQVELSAKSYIRPVDNLACPSICRFGPLDPECNVLAIAFCASMGTIGVLSDSESYDRTTTSNHRLFSKVTFELTCEDGRVTGAAESVAKPRESHVGKEGLLQPPNGDFDNVIAEAQDGVAHIGYMFSGRPHNLAEPGFQALRLRTCRWIWHYPFYKITSCDGNGGWTGERQFGGSSFPTRRVWRDGIEKETVEQGDIENLWIASSIGGAFVNGVFPNTDF